MPDARISELPAAVAPSDADLAPLVQTTASATLETRHATVAQLRAAVLTDRGAHVRDYGAVGDGVTNDAPAIQAAINDLKPKGGGTLLFGAKTYRLASAITITDTAIRLQGMGFNEGPGPAQGTWLKIDATGFTPFTFTGVNARGAAVSNLAVVQVHGAANDSSWTPTPYDYVFRVQDCLGGVDFDNLLMSNINRGIYCNNSGRLDIRHLRGQFLTTGIEIDSCYDVPRLHNLHFWPFATSNNYVLAWQQTQGDAMIFRRCDGVFIDQAFALAYRSMFRFTASTTSAGTTTKFYIGQAYADFTKYGVLIEADYVSGQIANMTHQGELVGGGGLPVPDGNGLRINASNTRVQAGNLRIDAVQNNAVGVNGNGNRVDIFSLHCVNFNSLNNGSAAIAIADSAANPPNAVYLGSPPQLQNGNNGPLVNGGTNGILATGTPAGRVARPGLMVGSTDTGFFLPSSGTLAGSAGGNEVLRATSAGNLTLGAAPGSHALEVVTPLSGSNRVLVNGAATGSGVSLQAQGADANIDISVSPKGSGLLRATSAGAADNSTAVATTNWVRTQGYLTSAAAAPVSSVAGKTGAVTLAVADVSGAAPLVSPAFTGVPTASTAAPGTNTGQLATTAFVLANAGSYTLPTASTTTLGGVKVDGTSIAINAGGVISAAGGGAVSSVAGRTGAVTLAVGDVSGAAPIASPSFTGTVTIPSGASIAGFAPLASPTLTGTPIAPTAANGTNTNQIATTAFVLANGGGYTLPTASTTVLGGVKVDNSTIAIASGVISAASGIASLAAPFVVTSGALGFEQITADASTGSPVEIDFQNAATANWEVMEILGAGLKVNTGTPSITWQFYQSGAWATVGYYTSRLAAANNLSSPYTDTVAAPPAWALNAAALGNVFFRALLFMGARGEAPSMQINLFTQTSATVSTAAFVSVGLNGYLATVARATGARIVLGSGNFTAGYFSARRIR